MMVCFSQFLMNSPFGRLLLTCEGNRLKKISFDENASSAASKSKPISIIVEQLNAYFENPAHIFQFDFALYGTPFQIKVWKALLRIPMGKTETYRQMAIKLNTSSRAIGQACRGNPLPIIIPCHRIVAADGIGGYSGHIAKWHAIKSWLLRHEGVDITSYGRERKA